MLLPLISLIAIWLTGTLLVNALFVSKRQRHWALSAAAGWLVGSWAASLLVSLSPFALVLTGQWLTLLLATILLIYSGRKWHRYGSFAPKVEISGGISLGKGQYFYALILALILTHLTLALLNILTRPVFPWDAFTTWLYRAKLWTLDNSITQLTYTPEWIAAEGTGAAIYASHYPELVSLIAAISATLAGGTHWHDAASGLPWILTLCALSLGVYGALRLWNCSRLWSLVGSYTITSLPMVGIHTALYGYADLWMATSAGLGLVLLLLGGETRQTRTLALAVTLLLVGTQIKVEGWAWLAVGVVFLVGDWSIRRFNPARVLLILVGIGLGYWFWQGANFSLGVAGSWGLSEEGILAGPLGNLQIRPYNPAARYVASIFVSQNFHLLGTLYLLGLLALALVQPGRAGRFWMMGALIVCSQLLIFGVSSFSQFAESGTAVNRLLLHFVPVFVITAILGAQQVQSALPDNRVSVSRLLCAFSLTVAVITVSTLVYVGASEGQVHRTNAQQFVTVSGSTSVENGALVFTDSNEPIGVIKTVSPPSNPASVSHVLVDVRGSGATSGYFYWIPEMRSEVIGVPIPAAGPTLIDLSEHQQWGVPLTEAGLIIPREGFEDARVHKLTFYQRPGISALGAVINQWRQPVPVTQASINDFKPSTKPFVSLTLLLNMSAIVILIGMTVVRFVGADVPWKSVMAALAILWLCNDAQWLWRYQKFTADASRGPYEGATDDWQSGAHLTEVAGELIEQLPNESPVIVIPADTDAQFEAQKLPFLLLPRKAVFGPPEASSIPRDWPGAVVVIGITETSVRLAATELREWLDHATRDSNISPTTILMAPAHD